MLKNYELPIMAQSKHDSMKCTTSLMEERMVYSLHRKLCWIMSSIRGIFNNCMYINTRWPYT